MLLTTIHGRRVGLTTEGRLGVLGRPYTATFSFAAGSSNQAFVSIIIRDPEGRAVTEPVNFDVWLTDSATGIGVTATTPSGAVTAATGAFLGTLTASKAFRAQTNASGQLLFSITDTAKTAFRVAVQIGDHIEVSNAMIAGNYGL